MLENEYLKITVADAGAELISVWDKTTGRECIWNADPAVWNRHAPILFPFVVVEQKNTLDFITSPPFRYANAIIQKKFHLRKTNFDG